MNNNDKKPLLKEDELTINVNHPVDGKLRRISQYHTEDGKVIYATDGNLEVEPFEWPAGLTIIQAVKSGKPFRRKSDIEMYGEDFWIEAWELCQKGVATTKEDILADDWEIKP